MLRGSLTLLSAYVNDERLLIRPRERGGWSEHIEADGARVLPKLAGSAMKASLNAPYRSGRARTWIKVRNKKAPAYTRVEDGTF